MATPTQSIEKLQKKWDKDPKSLIFMQLAEEYRKEGLLKEALRVCHEGLRRYPNYWSARVVMGRTYYQMGSIQEAREELEKVIMTVPDNLLANRLLGDVYLQLDRPQDALKRYKIVQMLAPSDREIVAGIHRLEERLSGATASEPFQETPPTFSAPPERPRQTAEVVAPALPATAPSSEPEPVVAKQMTEEEALPTVMIKPPFVEDFVEPAPAKPESGTVVHAEEQEASEPAGILMDPTLSEIASILLEDKTENEAEESPSAPKASGDARMASFTFMDTDVVDLEPVLQDEREVSETQDRTLPMAEKEEAAEEDADELTTETLAELYEQQGLVDKAVRVYQKLLLNDPNNLQIIQKLRELNPLDAFFSSAPEEPSQESVSAVTRPRSWEEAKAELRAKSMNQLADERRRKITTLENWLASIRRERD